MSLKTVHDLFLASFSYLQDQEFPQLIFWKSIFTWQYWVNTTIANPPTYAAFFILCYILPAYGLYVWQSILSRINKETPIYWMIIIQIRSILIFFTVGIVLYNFSYQQGIPYFSDRLLVLLIILVTILWTGFVIFFQTRIIPKKRQQHLEKERFFRYLPKKKERIVK